MAYTSIQLLIIEGSQDRILKRAETQRQDRSHGRMLLIGLLAHSFFNLLSYRTQDHLPRDGTAHSGLGTPTSTTNQENVPQASLQLHLTGALSQLFPLLKLLSS